MKILQVCSARTIGGGERHVAELANSLCIRGHEVYVALLPKSGISDDLKILPGDKLLPLRMSGVLSFLNAFKLARFIRQQQVDIIHAHLAHDYLPAVLAAAISGRTRLVITRHVLFPLNLLHQKIVGRASKIIAVSQAVAAVLRVGDIFEADKIVVIYNGVDTNRFAKREFEGSPAQTINGDGGESKSYVVGVVGHLAPIKGQEEFIRAAALIVSRRADVRFVIVGDDKSRSGENCRRLVQLINELGLGDRVYLSGWVDDVPLLLSTLDVLISSSRSEPFGLTIIEGMACGVPLIATMSEGAREILEDGVTGILVPVGNPEALSEAITDLLDDEQRRERLRTNALRVVHERFSLAAMVDATEQLYRNLLSSRD